MDQVIEEFFERFKNDMTQSKYASKGIQDYNKLKAYYDYLDYDVLTIYRDKKFPASCGLRNIGNSCYLNVFLQVLYHVNFFREKVFAYESSKSNVLEQLKYLFGRIQLGKLAYADPANLFQELKKQHPDVFIQGVQNDFHQICTILIDSLRESFKEQDKDSKIIDKLLLGKLTVKTFHPEGKSSRNTKFNIINLDVKDDNLQTALHHWKNYQIQEYFTQNNKKVKASVQTEFIETPAILTFFINRVQFKANNLVKDSRQFKFDDYLYLSKTTTNRNNVVKLTKTFSTKEEQLIEQKQKLSSWIQKVEKQKQSLRETLNYLEQKQFTNINLPQIQNKFQENSHFKEFLEEEIKQIDSKVEDSKRQIVTIQTKINQLYEENESELYVLWGMMIHEGLNPTSGHYKVILNLQGSQWVQFNDCKVRTITQQRVNEYSKKGQICCLFYRRPNLICSEKKVPVPGILKNKIMQIESNVLTEVDKARVLQNLYQISQSSGFLVQQQIREKDKHSWLYFFKPIQHCLEENYTFSQCQGVLTYENFKNTNNLSKLMASLLSKKQIPVQDFNLLLPQQYSRWAEIFRLFVKKQLSFELIEQSFEWLCDKIQVSVKNKTVNKWLVKYLQVIIMKGVFYLCVFNRASSSPLIEEKFNRLLSAVDKIMSKLNETSEFVLTYIPIKDEIKKVFYKKLLQQDKSQKVKLLKPSSNTVISKLLPQNEGQLFMERFGYWIMQREKLAEIDEEIIKSEVNEHNKYIIEIY